MKVICSGMSKTGTKTLSAALRILGYRVFDFEEQFFYIGDDLMKVMNVGWTKEDIRRIFDGVDAITDAPACILWEEIFKAFPDVKIIHTERSTEEIWGKSLQKQMESIKREKMNRFLAVMTPTGRKLQKFVNAAFRITFAGLPNSPLHFNELNIQFAMLRYREHNTHIHSVVPKNQILDFSLTDGWKPLCKFLEVAEPEVEFPHRNKGGSITKEIMDKSYVFDEIRSELKTRMLFLVVALTLVFYCILV